MRVRTLVLVFSAFFFSLSAWAQRFQSPVPYSTGALAPNGVAVGDLNGDGKLDVVVANEDNPGTIAVLLGNGDGTLQAPVNYAANSWPGFVALGDFNKDGHLDVAVANRAIQTPGQVLIFLGNGDGTLRAPVVYGPFTDAFSLTVADLNHDGALDIVISDTASGSLLMGKGDGTFRAGTPVGATDAVGFAVADFNRDHKPDLVALDNTGFTVQVFLGNGRGQFTPDASFPVTTPPIAVVARDFNNDGIPDFAVTNEAVNNVGSHITVFESQVGGYVETTYNFGDEPRSIAAADFNHDGKIDLVMANEFNGTLDLFRNTKNNVFSIPLVINIGAPTAVDVAVGDLNGDGKPDIVVTDGLNAVRVILQN